MPTLKSSAVSQLLEISKIKATIPGETAAIEYPTACVIIDRERVSPASTLRVTVNTKQSGNINANPKFEVNNQKIKCQPLSRVNAAIEIVRVNASKESRSLKSFNFDAKYGAAIPKAEPANPVIESHKPASVSENPLETKIVGIQVTAP